MQINLNDPSDFTLENVRRMLQKASEGQSRICITGKGFAFLSHDLGLKELDAIVVALRAFRSDDKEFDDLFVRRAYDWLRDNKPSQGFLSYGLEES